MFDRYSTYLVAGLPVVGITLAVVHQLGRMAFFQVPLELIEFNTVSIVTNGLALATTSTFGLIFLVVTFKDKSASLKKRIVRHLLIAGILTIPFWSRPSSAGPLPTFGTGAMVLALFIATFFTDKYFRELSRTEFQKKNETAKLLSYLQAAMYIAVFLIVCVFLHGYEWARSAASRTFIAGSNDMVIGKTGDFLITKPYNPDANRIEKMKTKLVALPADIEQRKLKNEILSD